VAVATVAIALIKLKIAPAKPVEFVNVHFLYP